MFASDTENVKNNFKKAEWEIRVSGHSQSMAGEKVGHVNCEKSLFFSKFGKFNW